MRVHIPQHVTTIVELNTYLSAVLKEDVHEQWWSSNMDKLNDRSPTQAWCDGDIQLVIDVVEGYFDPSYS